MPNRKSGRFLTVRKADILAHAIGQLRGLIYRLLMPPRSEEQRKRGLPDAEFQAEFINGRRESVGN